ncbi:MAG TPA: hypothetical protein DDZ78_12085, partial [Porphyromonadaceae bacterium]|nr:hypothetical protein [Porphyromonadaceae bacterium]
FITCESWLDIKPADRISGRELFETREGFIKALNGVYTGLNARSIYGREMTAGVLDIMAQYYSTNSNFHNALIQYNYEDDGSPSVKTTFDNIWSTNYNLIINLNIIIEKCDDNKSVLNGIWYNLIKGEALALRAFLHLDLLRIFGPTYSTDPDGLYIPYITNSDQSVSPLRSSKDILVKDLTDAIALLKESDPIIENGVMLSDSDDGDNSLRYRQFRLNYYAARALLARTYLWFEDKTNAYTTAKELLNDIGETVFPFVSVDAVTQSTNPDRVFSSEVMFATYDNNRGSAIYDYYFSPTASYSGSFGENYLQMSYVGNVKWSGRISQLFITESDIRYKAWLESYAPSNNSTELHYLTKYQVSPSNRPVHMYMIPLIRISEVYFIIAECSTNFDEAKDYFSKIRVARFAFDLESANQGELMSNIEWEYRREFLGEGQMFYFYKRREQQTIPAGDYPEVTEVLQMSKAQYIVPMPDSEANERVSTDKSN